MNEELCRRLANLTMDDKRESERKLIVRVGDAVKQKFWPLVTKDRQADPSCVCVADKNVPPPSWNAVGEACAKTRGIPIPVFPDAMALQTTSITGVTKPDDTKHDDLSHFYPFSLSYLAVCMARVMERPPKSHQGKLDQSTQIACMVVVLFYSFYRNISSDVFKETLNRRLQACGALDTGADLELPFFSDKDSGSRTVSIPRDLSDALVEALQLQVCL